jgi:phosphohistidine swiveling domain-containing protein
MKPDFQKIVSRRHALLLDHALVSAWNEPERFGRLTGIPEYVRNLEVIDGDFYLDFNWVRQIVDKYASAPPRLFWSFVRRGYVHGERWVAFAARQRVDRELAVLKRDFWKSLELMKNLLVFLPVTHPLAKAVEKRALGILKAKGVPEAELTDALLEVSAPLKLNDPRLEARDLLRIKVRSLADTAFDVEKALAAHTERYRHLGYREPFSEGYDVAFFRKRLEELSSTLPKEEPRYRLRFTPAEKEWVELLKEFVYFRNYRTERLYQGLFHIESLWRRLAELHHLAPVDLGYYLTDEIEGLFERGERAAPTLIEERKRGYGFLLHDGRTRLITGGELLRKKEEYAKRDLKVREIKGMIACRGRVTGLARIVPRAAEQAKVEKGGILVTSMTTPDFLPGMRRAAAFVTDEGGITCHAAIVSREMNKPCIIGTRVATKLLKDGDLIEVDASKGVVRILKRG